MQTLSTEFCYSEAPLNSQNSSMNKMKKQDTFTIEAPKIELTPDNLIRTETA